MEQLLNLVKGLLPILSTLFGVWLGWFLTSRSQRKQDRLDRLAESFSALREVRQIVENIPPDLDEGGLMERLEDARFLKRLSQCIVRLFGLRNEHIPVLDSEIVDFIDN